MGKATNHQRKGKSKENTARQETAVRTYLARRGYRIMHRRNGQYWVMLGNPMTLDQIETWARPREAR